MTAFFNKYVKREEKARPRAGATESKKKKRKRKKLQIKFKKQIKKWNLFQPWQFKKYMRY